LLIFDSADSPADLFRYMPPGPGHVLVTSRELNWSTEHNALPVDVFAPQESLIMLQQRWPELTTEQANELADKLGHLPLALEQAIAVHQQTGMSWAEYLATLDSKPRFLLGEGSPAGYPNSVAKTLEIAYGRLKEQSPAAAQLLELCAFLSANQIAVPMLMRGRGAPLPEPLSRNIRDDALLRMTVREIGRYSLAHIDPGRDLIRIHGLTAALLRAQLPEQEREMVQANAHAVLGLANPGRPDDPINWPQFAQLGPHIIPSGVLYSDNVDARRAALDQIRYLFALGDYVASRDLSQIAVEIWNGSLGPNDEMTLIATRHLANSLAALGEYSQSRQLNEEVYRRMRENLPPDHEHTLATAMNVAADLRLAGDFNAARELDAENLERYREVMGEDDLGTLRQAHNLAVDLRLLGDGRGALRLDEHTVERRGEILGQDHPRTLYTYVSLVRDLYSLGEYQKALALQRDKLRVHEQKLRPRHSDLAAAKRNLAMLWRKTGNYRRALEQASSNLEVLREANVGSRNVGTLASMLTLCNSLRAVGDFETALKRGTEALALYRETLGPEHPFAHACAVDVAIVLRRLRRWQEAAAMNQAALAGLNETLGEDHPHTLCAAINSSNDLAAAEDHHAAYEVSQKTWQRSISVRGEEHPNTLICAANVALDLDSIGDVARANDLRKQTLSRLQRRLGQEHPETIDMSMGRRMDCDIEVSAL
jgi:hypothetical protein